MLPYGASRATDPGPNPLLGPNDPGGPSRGGGHAEPQGNSQDTEGTPEDQLVARAARKQDRVPEAARNIIANALTAGAVSHKELAALLFPSLATADQSAVLSVLLAAEALGDLFVAISVWVFASEDPADRGGASLTLEDWSTQTAQRLARTPRRRGSPHRRTRARPDGEDADVTGSPRPEPGTPSGHEPPSSGGGQGEKGKHDAQ